jgi:hypothetical protein
VPVSESAYGAMARALVMLAERDEADGRVWHLPAADPLTGRELLTLIF